MVQASVLMNTRISTNREHFAVNLIIKFIGFILFGFSDANESALSLKKILRLRLNNYYLGTTKVFDGLYLLFFDRLFDRTLISPPKIP